MQSHLSTYTNWSGISLCIPPLFGNDLGSQVIHFRTSMKQAFYLRCIHENIFHLLIKILPPWLMQEKKIFLLLYVQ